MIRKELRLFFLEVRREMNKKDWTQKRVAQEAGYSEGLVSRYFKEEDAPRNFLEDLAGALNSKKLRLILYGTTTKGTYMNGVMYYYPLNLKRLKKECQELIEAIETVENYNQFENAPHISYYNQEQIDDFKFMMQQMDDVKQGIEIVNIAADDFGLCCDEASEENQEKFKVRGYIQKDTYSPQVSVPAFSY